MRIWVRVFRNLVALDIILFFKLQFFINKPMFVILNYLF